MDPRKADSLVAAALTLLGGLAVGPGFSGLAAAAPGAAVGVVSEYSPTSARYALKRDGESPGGTVRVPVRIGTIVMAGDEVVLPPKSSITLSPADGPARRIDGPGTFRIPPGRDLGVTRRLVQAVTSIFDVQYRSALTAVSRGDAACEPVSTALPIVVPIIRKEARVLAGVRDIPLAWTGGCSPYTVTLLRDEAVVARQENISRSQLRLDGVTLVSGTTYTVAITDSRGARRAVEITAVSRTPTPPADLDRDTSALGVTARALWLGDKDGGAWRLDSFEMLRPAIRLGDPLAGRIGDVLLWQDVAQLLERHD